MSKHTPGPWTYSKKLIPPKVKDRRSGFVVNGPDPDDDMILPVRVCDIRVPAGIDGFSEGEANARLIAAAPDLLAALQDVMGWFDSSAIRGLMSKQGFQSECHRIINEARDAIRKAVSE